VNLTHPFYYETWPVIRVIVHGPHSGLTDEYDALIDTGAQVSVFDTTVADDLEIDLSSAERFLVSVVGGQRVEARIAPIRLALLQLPDLTIELDVVLAPGIASRTGNVIGLDVLAHFDLALSHSQRVGFLGRTRP
jgi:hypothetical protein